MILSCTGIALIFHVFDFPGYRDMQPGPVKFSEISEDLALISCLTCYAFIGYLEKVITVATIPVDKMIAKNNV